MGLFAFDAPYPWDAVEPLREKAQRHPDGLVDLSIGTPVDPTPEVIQRALREESNSPGYPTVAGPASLRQAIVDWYARCRGVAGLTVDHTFPTIGSKEMVALLPSQLGLGPGDAVVIPTRAYPTYEVGARLAGAEVVVSDDPNQWRQHGNVRLVWVNTPGNPTGEVLGVGELRRIVAAAREVGAVVASDECYAMLPWSAPVPSVLSGQVNGGELTGLLALYSLSKQSNLAGYRAALIAGDQALIQRLLLQRRHMGMMLPAPVQHAMEAALRDDDHVAAQWEIYRQRREVLIPALHQVGFEIDDSEAGLYLWVRPGPDLLPRLDRLDGEDLCWSVMRFLAERGIIAGPGAFYGAAAADHVRISLTAPDAAIASAAVRLGT